MQIIHEKKKKKTIDKRISLHFVRWCWVVDFPDVLSLPLQFVFVESINKFVVVTPDDASGNDDEIIDGPTLRGDDEPLFEDAVLVEPIPDVSPEDDGWSCCHGGILSLLLSKRLASSNDIFLLSINCFAK